MVGGASWCSPAYLQTCTIPVPKRVQFPYPKRVRTAVAHEMHQDGENVFGAPVLRVRTGNTGT
jgi:hypothetical protein